MLPGADPDIGKEWRYLLLHFWQRVLEPAALEGRYLKFWKEDGWNQQLWKGGTKWDLRYWRGGGGAKVSEGSRTFNFIKEAKKVSVLQRCFKFCKHLP